MTSFTRWDCWCVNKETCKLCKRPEFTDHTYEVNLTRNGTREYYSEICSTCFAELKANHAPPPEIPTDDRHHLKMIPATLITEEGVGTSLDVVSYMEQATASQPICVYIDLEVMQNGEWKLLHIIWKFRHMWDREMTLYPPEFEPSYGYSYGIMCGYLYPSCNHDGQQPSIEGVPITHLRASLHYLHAGKGRKVLSTHTIPYSKWSSMTYYVDGNLQVHIEGNRE